MNIRQFLEDLAVSGVSSRDAAIEAAKTCKEVIIGTTQGHGWNPVLEWNTSGQCTPPYHRMSSFPKGWQMGDPLPNDRGEDRTVGLIRSTFLSEPVGAVGQFVTIGIYESVTEEEYNKFVAGDIQPRINVVISERCGYFQCGWCGWGTVDEPCQIEGDYECRNCGGS